MSAEQPGQADDAATLGPSPPVQPSILKILEQKIGAAPHVALHEQDSDGGASPIIDPSSEDKHALPRGRGNYHFSGEIARGGMGVVIKGHDEDLGRDVAVKILNKDLTQRPEALQRFVEEAQIGGQLQHPGIVPVYELGLMADERPYFTMKLVKGRTLATLLAERESVTDDRRHLLEVFVSICQTLAYAHSRGVIHRDLKPANIMVGAFGEVQVVDWGLAKVLARGGVADEKKAKDARSIHTVLETVRSQGSSGGSGSGTDSLVGSVMGTPAYMPPEQAQGQVDRLDERSDVFSLGAILCEILTGQPPYAGEKDKTLAEAAQGETQQALERLDTCQADPELLKLTKQCLVAAPAARPRNAGVLAERIHKHLVSVEERAHAAQIEAAVQRKGRKLTAALAATVLVAALGGGGGWVWGQNERAVREREAAMAEREGAARELEIAEREREITAGVTTALNEASLLQGQELWSGAFSAVDRARALAEAGGAGPDLHARIEAVSADVQAASDEVRLREELALQATRFLAELDGVGQDENWSAIDEGHAQVFDAHGIDVDGSDPDQVADALAERGLGSELGPALDRWLVARRSLSRQQAVRAKQPEDKAGALHLIEIAHRIDDEPLRADLREAMLNDDLEMLELLAGSDLSTEHPSTLTLLGTALELAGERAQANRVLRRGVAWHPDEYELRIALVNNLGQNPFGSSWDPEQAHEKHRHLAVALALRPGNIGVRWSKLWHLRDEGTRAVRKGDAIAAQRAYRVVAAEYESLLAVTEFDRQWQRTYYASVLELAGEPERALAEYRTAFSMSETHWTDRVVGLALQQRGLLDEAEVALARAVERAPDLDEFHRRLAIVRALKLARNGDAAGAAASLRSSVETYPQDPTTEMNALAWIIAKMPREALPPGWNPRSNDDEERIHQALDALLEEALLMAEAAAENDSQGLHRNTVGVLRYRLGDFEGALDDLTLAMELKGGGTAFDFFFAAMAHQRLGNEEPARAFCERGTRGMLASLSPGDLDELLVFRKEAAGWLGIEGY